MNQKFIANLKTNQGGIVSILVIVFLLTVVVFILSQPIFMSSSRTVDDTQQLTSLNSMYMAENGIEQAAAQLVTQADFGLPEFKDTCDTLASQAPFSFGDGVFRFVAAPVNPKPSCCNIRAQGEVNGLTRTFQKTLCVQSELGHANFGGKLPAPVVMKIKNRSAKDGVAVFNFAWRRQGSDGNTTIGNSVSAQCNNCVAPNPLWQLESSQGIPSVGSFGAGKLVPRRERVDIEVSIQENRNYVYVGMILPGDNVRATGSYFLEKNGGTKGPSASETSDGAVVDGMTQPIEKPWCSYADTMILGISGKADPASNLDLSAKFSEVTFDFGSGTQQKNWTLVKDNNPNYVAHFPIKDTPFAWGDIFSEIYVLFNPSIGPEALPPAPASTSGMVNVTKALDFVTRKVVLESTNELRALVAKKKSGEEIVDPVIRIRPSASGFLPSRSRIILQSMREVPEGLEFELDFRNPDGTLWSTPTPTLPVNAKICGGICAFFNPSGDTPFRLTKVGGVTQWAGGFACYSGVDGAEVRPFAQITPSFGDWREIVQ
jgi:hypothetical protein